MSYRCQPQHDLHVVPHKDPGHGPRGPRDGGITPQWLGVRDDKGRLMVAISFNSDIGDSWEFADLPAYPERFSALGIRIGVNYVMYSMTH